MGALLAIDAGTQYGRLTVLSEGPRVGKQRARTMYCRCECGAEDRFRLGDLRSGHTNGCLSCNYERFRAQAPTQGASHRRHGHSWIDKKTGKTVTSPTYGSWRAMKRRCTEPNNVVYHNYGGRGITVCERWMTFDNFLEDMGERPDGKTIDRIDNDGNYEPGNCRWATQSEQNRNQRPRNWATK